MHSATVTAVPDSATSVELVGGSNRRGAVLIFNASDEVLYLRFGDDDAADDDYSISLATGQLFESYTNYKGAIQGIWAAGSTGFAYVTEIPR